MLRVSTKLGQKIQWISCAGVLAASLSCAGRQSEPAPVDSSATSESSAADPEVESKSSAEPERASDAPPAQAERGATDSVLDPPPSSEDELMHLQFRQVEAIRKALIQGDSAATGRPANVLIAMSTDAKVPKEWEVSVERMQQAARRVVDAGDVAQAAAGVADMGVACGLCHQKLGGPKEYIGNAPVSDGTVAGRMAQHVWATERLWEGLYVPSARAWKVGAAALKDQPFPEEVLQRGGVYARTAAQDFSKIVAKAPSKDTAQKRAELYAELIGTCAACHLAVE